MFANEKIGANYLYSSPETAAITFPCFFINAKITEKECFASIFTVSGYTTQKNKDNVIISTKFNVIQKVQIKSLYQNFFVLLAKESSNEVSNEIKFCCK